MVRSYLIEVLGVCPGEQRPYERSVEKDVGLRENLRPISDLFACTLRHSTVSEK